MRLLNTKYLCGGGWSAVLLQGRYTHLHGINNHACADWLLLLLLCVCKGRQQYDNMLKRMSEWSGLPWVYYNLLIPVAHHVHCLHLEYISQLSYFRFDVCIWLHHIFPVRYRGNFVYWSGPRWRDGHSQQWDHHAMWRRVGQWHLYRQWKHAYRLVEKRM